MDDRRKLADGKEIWVIKAGFPDAPVKKWWSEYVFSNSLKKYLERLGYYVVIESYDEWYDGGEADVVIVLRGHKAYFPDRSNKECLYIMWNLSHPATITDEEYQSYDLLCIGSPKHAEKVAQKVTVPIKYLPMCADTEIFYPDESACASKEYDWIFVGNSRYVRRKSVSWSIAHGIPLKIWGANWKNFIPDSEKYVVADNIPNDELPELYRHANVTVDDLYDDLFVCGFINTRIIEAFACGLPVISDYSEVLFDMFGDAVLCYRDEEEFVRQTGAVVENYDIVREKVRALWPLIREQYSFHARAGQLAAYSKEIKEYGRECIRLIDGLMSPEVKGKPEQILCRRDKLTDIKVSVIVAVYNASAYLADCMDSITGQTLREIEIICIDDGSEDESLEILKSYAKTDGRISVFTQENCGLSTVRNRGCKKALGEYVYFIDSDDVLEEKALETLYLKSNEKKLDLLCFNGKTIYETSEDMRRHSEFQDYYLRKASYPECCTGTQMLTEMRRNGEYRASVVMQFYRREFLEGAGLLFYPGILHEDNDFSFRAMLKAGRAGYLPADYYRRRVHEGSIMSGTCGIAHTYGYFRVLMNMVSFAQQGDYDADTQEMICDILKGVRCSLKERYQRLTYQERNAFDRFQGAERFYFWLCVKQEEPAPVRTQEKEDADMKRKLQKLDDKLSQTYKEKSEINAKLQQTYKEKSEINRKLQITYGEKYDRGLRIKSLEKELASLKRSRSYRLARLIGFPVRCFRKLIKAVKNSRTE